MDGDPVPECWAPGPECMRPVARLDGARAPGGRGPGASVWGSSPRVGVTQAPGGFCTGPGPESVRGPSPRVDEARTPRVDVVRAPGWTVPGPPDGWGPGPGWTGPVHQVDGDWAPR